MSAGADEAPRIPAEALRPVRHALAAVHAAIGLQATLEAVALGVTTSTPYQCVAVTVAKKPNASELDVVAVIGPPEARDQLLDTTCRREALLEHLAGGEAWGALRFRPGSESTAGIITYTQEYEPLGVPDAWQPQFELIAPLHAPDGELIGMLSMDRPRGGRIPPAWVNQILELFAEQAAIAILNARRHDQAVRALEREKERLHAAFTAQTTRASDLHRETRRDPLTGLANRVRLLERLSELLAARAAVTVVFCDLDRFKQINDTHGHAVGDEVLRAVGRSLSRNLADAEVVARMGGDEFVVVWADAAGTCAPMLLERIEQAFADAEVRAGALRLHVAASLGLVHEPGGPQRRLTPARRVQEILDSADREMYAHKRSRAGMDQLMTMADVEKGAPTNAGPGMTPGH